MSRLSLRALALAVPTALLLAFAVAPSSAVQRNVTIYQIQDTTLAGHVAEGRTDTLPPTGLDPRPDNRGPGPRSGGWEIPRKRRAVPGGPRGGTGTQRTPGRGSWALPKWKAGRRGVSDSVRPRASLR